MAGPGALLVRTDAGREIGIGHLMRCIALAQAWQDMGGQATFIMAAPSEHLRSRLSREDIDVVDLNVEPASENDAEATSARAQELRATTVIDGYHFGVEYQRHVHRTVPNLVVIDDHGSIGSYRANWILDQNLDANTHMYAERPSSARLLLGTTYTLLRREFPRYRQTRPKLSNSVRRVLVTFGGGNTGETTSQAIAALDSIERHEFEVVVVLGVTCRPARTSDPSEIESRHKLEFVFDVSDMAALMHTIDLAISGAGSTSWELACLGVPAILAPIADNQRPIMAALQREGAAVGVTASGTDFVERLARSVDTLASDAERRVLMSERGMALVDGLGAARVAATISEAR